MKYPNIWGAGALFCHSGLSGENDPARAVCGRLMGDFIGVECVQQIQAVCENE